MRLEAQDICYRDAVQATANFPDGQDFRVDEFVDRLTTELPAAAQLRHRQPHRIDTAPGPMGSRNRARHVASRARCRRSRSSVLRHNPRFLRHRCTLSGHYAPQVPRCSALVRAFLRHIDAGENSRRQKRNARGWECAPKVGAVGELVFRRERKVILGPHWRKLRLEAQNVLGCNTIEMRANPPGGQDSGADEFVDRFATELPAVAQLSDAQPKRTNTTAEAAARVGR